MGKESEMKNFLYTIVLFSAGIYALYEQSKPEPNKFVMYGAIVIFGIGLYRIMKKIPSKHNNDEQQDE